MTTDYVSKCLELARNVPQFFNRPDDSDWRRLESDLGLVFPPVHKAFVNAFGSGYFGPFMLWNPASKGIFELSRARLLRTREECVALDDMDVKVFPADGGFVIVADGTSSNLYALQPSGKYLLPELIEIDLGGHNVVPTGMDIAKYHFLSFTTGLRGEEPLQNCSYTPFFRPIDA
jgi:hypothetical protein